MKRILVAAILVGGLGLAAPTMAEAPAGISGAAVGVVQAERMGDAPDLAYSLSGCSAGRVGMTLISAAHCENWVSGWTVDPIADLMWKGDEPNWSTARVGMNVHGVSWPHFTHLWATEVHWDGVITEIGTTWPGRPNIPYMVIASDTEFCETGASGTLVRDETEEPVAAIGRKIDLHHCMADIPTSALPGVEG